MTYNELSGPDFNSYLVSPSGSGIEVDATAGLIEERGAGGLSFHPERIRGGLEADEAVLLFGGLEKIRYRSSDWIARATEMKGEIVE